MTLSRDWLLLAKLADAVKNGRAMIAELPELAHEDPRWATPEQYRISIKVLTDERPTDFLGHDENDALAFAERMALLWGERAAELEKSAGATPPSERVELKRGCLTCGVPSGQRCKPVHEGERETGNWVHPIRQVEDMREADPSNQKALRHAREFLEHRGALANAINGTRAREMVELLAKEAVASERLRKLGFAHHFRDVFDALEASEHDKRNKERIARAKADAMFVQAGAMSPAEAAAGAFGSHTILMNAAEPIAPGTPVVFADGQTVRPASSNETSIAVVLGPHHGDPSLVVVRVN